MKKKILVMTLCCLVSIPVAVFGEDMTEPGVQASRQAEASVPVIDDSAITKVDDMVTVAEDTDVLDFPGRKEGSAIGEVLEGDEISRTGTIDDIWSQIVYEDDNGAEQTGYIPTSVLEGYTQSDRAQSTATSDGTVEAGIIHKSTGEGVFAEAVDGVTLTGEAVQEGQPIMVSTGSNLRSLGVFHITHYCQCSICCGPWANGITSTGVTATTNRTIAVDPTVIPYGSKVVINGQVYVAEDCGGAIKNNHIDIYMGSHAEALSSGVFDVEVYLLEETPSQESTETNEDTSSKENEDTSSEENVEASEN